jgi:DNA end-binding protein Ku
MALRSVWHGTITFSLVSIGIKLYTAIESAQKIAFNQLHKGDCLGQVGRKEQCKKCDEVIETKDEIAKGYKHGDDQWVVVTPEEIESITPQSNKNIQVLGFVDRTEIPDTFFDAPYLVTPDSPASGKSYALFKAVMEQTNKVAIGKVILRDREDPVVISATPEGLIIQTLRYAREVRTFAALPQQNKTEVAEEELQLATTVVERMITSFAEIDLTDHYYVALRELLDKKIAGEEVKTVDKPAEPGKVVDIMAALRASLTIATQVPESSGETATTAQPTDPISESAEQEPPQLSLVPQAVPRKKNRRAA